ncbi:unnamed protein product, partial [Thlaspi arvense]
EESSKLETNGMSTLESVSIETTQDQVFLAGKGTQETEPQNKESVEDTKVKDVEEEMHQNGLESLVLETDEKLQKQTSVAEGAEAVCEAAEVEELSMIGDQSVASKLNTKEFLNEEKPSVIDEIAFVSPRLYETVRTEEENIINETLEEIVPEEVVAKLDQDTGMQQEIEAHETLNLDRRSFDDEEEVTNEEKADQVISNFGSQESNVIQEAGLEVYKEGDMESGREASLKRMSRCRSLPVSHNTKVMEDSLVQRLVSEVLPSRNKMGLEKSNMYETLLVSCEGSNKVQETTEAITESNKHAEIQMRSPRLGSDLRVEERSDESTEKTLLFSHDKIETYDETINVEEKTIMLNSSESEQTRGIELSLGLSMKHMETSEADDSFKETKGSRENLEDKKANTSETPVVDCVGGSNIAQVTTEAITESSKESRLEMQSPSFGNDLRIDERSDESTEKAPLLCQDKTETYEATIDVEEKTVMLKRSETEQTRGIELSLGLSMKHMERSESDDSYEETKGSRENLQDEKANTTETPAVSCAGSNKAQVTTEAITESSKESRLEMRSPSFGNDLKYDERSDESAEKTQLLCQDKTETYEADVEEKTVMLKRSETEKTRGFELSLGLSMKPGERFEADDGFEETKGSGDNLLDKKASLDSMKGRVRKRSKSSLLGTCLCCATAMN